MPTSSAEYKREYRKKNAEKAREWNRRYRAAHPERARESVKKSRARNQEAFDAYQREWRRANREKVRGYEQKVKDKDPAAWRERRRQYARAEHDRRRHGGLSAELFQQHGGLCASCREPAALIHHIDGKGTTVAHPNNAAENQVPLCHRCHRGLHAAIRRQALSSSANSPSLSDSS